jgi:prepilin-type N-terminal cleavage/methylation domain-containing protein
VTTREVELLTAKQHTAGAHNHSERAGSCSGLGEQGFSLIELLVVCLVIAALCAIAIPQFLQQSAKAKDGSAKELLHSAQVSAEALATEDEGSYESVTTTELERVEPSLPIEASASNAYLLPTTHSAKGYSITAKATDGDELTITKGASGAVTRTCASPSNGCSEGKTGNW